jgi:hypothetical protein
VLAASAVGAAVGLGALCAAPAPAPAPALDDSSSVPRLMRSVEGAGTSDGTSGTAAIPSAAPVGELQRRVRLSAADPGSTPVTHETVAAAVALLHPATLQAQSTMLEARRGFAVVTLTAAVEADFRALDSAVVHTLLGGGLDVSYGRPAVSDDHRGSLPELRVRRWHVSLPESQVALSRKERDLAARAHSFGTLFEKNAGETDPDFRVTLCGVDDPLNVGLVMRLLSCFGAGKLRHLSYESGGDRGFWTRKETVKKIQRVAKGGAAKRYLPLDTVPVDGWVREQTAEISPPLDCGSNSDTAHAAVVRGPRVPVIALETAAHATNLCEFKFPQKCDIMVGAEDTGISTAVVDALDPSKGDAVVYIPLPGVYHSLNVATALSIAMYEYRRQWPGEDTTKHKE